MRVAVLDDYLDIARSLADWDSLDGVEADFFIEHIADENALVQALQGYEIVSLMRERTPLPAAVLERLPDLGLVVTAGMYNASVDMEAAIAQGITVCGTSMAPTPTPELTWGLMVALARGIPDQDRSIRDGRWQTRIGTGLHGKRLGIIGLGRIGERLAEAGKLFGMDVVAWSQNLTSERTAEVGVELVSKEELLRTSDVVTIHLRLSERTTGLLGSAELALMKSTALLINTSRGPIVDESALVDALQQEQIGGAALDVFDQEPIPVDHPLLALDNVVLTPHIGYATRENFERVYRETVEDIAAFVAGDPIRVVKAPS